MVHSNNTRDSSFSAETVGGRNRSLLGRNRIQHDVEPGKLVVRGAQQHNLKNVNVSIPRHKLVVVTGVSGSGKSSLVFDTIYAEAQRRFVESLSPFLRHFMEKAEKPKVEFIGGLTPALAIEQRVLSNNPRSTMGTVTEISHYLRLLYSRIGLCHCLQCGQVLRPQSARQVANRILSATPPGTPFSLFAPIICHRDKDLLEAIEQARHDGFTLARIDGKLIDLARQSRLAGKKIHLAEILIDELEMPAIGTKAQEDFDVQLVFSIKTAMRIGKSIVIVALPEAELAFSSQLVCTRCRSPFPELTSQHFSFNSPLGMCPDCRGLGVKPEVDPALLIHDPRLSILDGALTWFGNLRENKRTTWPLGPLDVIAEHYNVDLNAPWQDLPEKFRQVILYGSGKEKIRFPPQTGLEEWVRPVKGLVPEIARLFRETESESMRKKYGAYIRQRACPACGGSRLNERARAVTLGGKTIADVSAMAIDTAIDWIEELYKQLDDEQSTIAEEILYKVYDRLCFLVNVGLHYLTLNRSAPSLSGGEGQRVRLASQLGSGLTGVLYVLDEPSIGLHARDQRNLLSTLMQLRDLGNTVLVVEHDAETMLAADWLIDMGPGAGILGGEIVAAGHPDTILASPNSTTGQYLSGKIRVLAPNGGYCRRPTNAWLTICGARLHNLKSITARFPLGLMICVTGVSGSGKSSLVVETLEPALARALNNAETQPGPYDWIEGLDTLDKVISITHDPIGRTPRSNPATYTKVFDQIRRLFAGTEEAKKQRYGPSYFSFNTGSGRCDSCKGLGQIRIEMHFLPDVWVTCQDCNGTRYDSRALGIRYSGRNIAEVLEMDIEESLAFFADHPAITRVLRTLKDVGLGYVKLGQSAVTLSGGEAQRVKLAKELGRAATGRTVYILDEPTTGLHFADIQHLLNVLHRLVDAGNTVIIIEHNMDIIKTADWIIDMGPEGGDAGGRIIAEGTPEEIAQNKGSFTGQVLRGVLERS